MSTLAIWKFRVNITMTDPASGNLRFDRTDLTLATAMAIAEHSTNNVDIGALLAGLVAGDEFTVASFVDPTKWATFALTAPAVDQTEWWQVPVVSVASNNGTFLNDESLTVALSAEPPIDVPGTASLVSLADAKVYLHITDPARDAEVSMLLTQASALVYDYIGARANPDWDEDTAPPVVQAATLKMLGHLYEHRGDDAAPDLHDQRIWESLSLTLMRTRDPGLA